MKLRPSSPNASPQLYVDMTKGGLATRKGRQLHPSQGKIPPHSIATRQNAKSSSHSHLLSFVPHFDSGALPFDIFHRKRILPSAEEALLAQPTRNGPQMKTAGLKDFALQKYE